MGRRSRHLVYKKASPTIKRSSQSFTLGILHSTNTLDTYHSTKHNSIDMKLSSFAVMAIAFLTGQALACANQGTACGPAGSHVCGCANANNLVSITPSLLLSYSEVYQLVCTASGWALQNKCANGCSNGQCK